MIRATLMLCALALVIGACNEPSSAPAREVVSISIVETTTSIPSAEADEPRWTTAAPNPNTSSPAPTPIGEFIALELTLVEVTLDEPVWLGAPPNDPRIFIATKGGQVWISENGDLREGPFFDVSDRIRTDHIERGLLGFAFHPDFWLNGMVYAYMTDRTGTAILVEYTLAERNPERVDLSSARIILSLEQFHPAHQGGGMQFGPQGNLWIGIGDGGISSDEEGALISDPRGHGQNPATQHGSLLRIDVDDFDSDRSYAIPGDNPDLGAGAAPGVWAYGLRNPWRITIDEPTNTLYVADVGFEQWDEVNTVNLSEGGVNFGWPVWEGPECFEAETCDPVGFETPTIAVHHDDGCALVGGPVYRGGLTPELTGHYFYGDFCRGWIRSIRIDASEVTAEAEWFGTGELANITSFGTDGRGELYVLTLANGIYRLDAVRSGS